MKLSIRLMKVKCRCGVFGFDFLVSCNLPKQIIITFRFTPRGLGRVVKPHVNHKSAVSTNLSRYQQIFSLNKSIRDKILSHFPRHFQSKFDGILA